jgi:hypothetical protein
MTDGTDVATILHSSPLTGQDAWWEEEADEVAGNDLVKDEALFALVGVPFRIFELTFRQGIQQKGVDWRNDYVSAELRVAPATILVRQLPRIMSRRTGKLITDVRAIADPGEQLVINDGSTGFYRQAVQYLEAKELITVPDTLPAEGGKNECRYDLPATEFVLSDDGIREGKIEQRFTPEGESVAIFRVALNCPRGLRYSDYKNEYTDDDGAITWYIA